MIYSDPNVVRCETISGDDSFFSVVVEGVSGTSKTFTKRKHPASNLFEDSAIQMARKYAVKLKSKYPTKRVFILQSASEVL